MDGRLRGDEPPVFALTPADRGEGTAGVVGQRKSIIYRYDRRSPDLNPHVIIGTNIGAPRAFAVGAPRAFADDPARRRIAAPGAGTIGAIGLTRFTARSWR